MPIEVHRIIGMMLGVSDVDLPFKCYIMKTSPCNEDPLTSHFYIVKWGLQGYTLFFIFAQKHRLWLLVRTAAVRRF